MSPSKTVEVSTADIITSLINQETFQQLRIFPNPSHGTFSISYPSEIKLLEIHDISGKVVYRKALDTRSNNENLINTSTELRKEVYIINAEIASTILSKKIIIN